MTSPLAATYAQALLDLANQQNNAIGIGAELKDLAQILDAEPNFRLFLADPAISKNQRDASVRRIFQGRVSNLVMNFLGVMNLHHRLGMLDQVVTAYMELLDQQLGNVEVDVTSASQLAPDEAEQVRQRVGQALGKNAIMHQYTDDAIIGGLVIRVGDLVIDASVRQQLLSMKQQLLSAQRKVRA